MSDKFNIAVLIAPLDWGLGHATRCVPIIQHLISKGCTVYVAAEGSQKVLLEKEFPSIKILTLQGYRIQYSKTKRLFALKIILQLPRIIHTIKTENKWLEKVIADYNIRAVISDNRYGMHSNNIHSIFITHQLQIQAPFKFLEQLLLRLNYRYINKFNQCWVPDVEGRKTLAGALSHPAKKPVNGLKYLGGISRLRKAGTMNYRYDFLAIISGPEPQRYQLEQMLFNQLKNYSGNGLILRGLPGEGELTASFGKVIVLNHLPASELETAMNESEFIISRSGYTTLMDIIKLKKKSILIPTPGQTEQEYLAKHFEEQRWGVEVTQKNFELNAALYKAKRFSYDLPDFCMDGYTNILDDFIKTVQGEK